MLPDFEPENPQLARKGLLIVAAIVVVVSAVVLTWGWL